MAFAQPTLTEIIDRVLADISSRVVGVDGAVLRRSVLGVIGRGLAGASHELHGHLDYIAQQVIIDTADAEYLERWSNIWGVLRKPAEYATGNVTFTGTNGSVIPSGTLLQRQDGVLFETTEEVTISSGAALAAAQAQDAGSDGNTLAGVSLSLVQPVSGVQSASVVASGGIANGSNTEDDDSLRARLLARIQQPPQGGAANDYIAWALEVPGVTRAWVYPMEMGPGTVTVRFVRDEDVSIIPDSTEVDAVFDHIEELRPVTAELFVAAPVPLSIDFDIRVTPDTSSVRASVQAELIDLITRKAEPGGAILLTQINEAISIAAGEQDHVLLSPSANVTTDVGEMAVFGSITWTDD